VSPAPDRVAQAAETARILADSLKNAERLGAVVAELESQLKLRTEELAKLTAECEHAAVLANYVREECVSLRARLMDRALVHIRSIG
jgi:hypothetical protein